MGCGTSKESRDRLLETLDSEAGPIICMALSQDKSLLATGHEDGTVRAWYLSDIGEDTICLCILKGHTEYVSCVAVSDTFVITGSDDKTVRKWDLATCDCLDVYKGHTGKVNRIICTQDFIFSTSSDKTARAWIFTREEHDDTVLKTFEGHHGSVSPIIYIPGEEEDGLSDTGDEDDIFISPLDIVITGSGDGTAKSWAFDTGACLKTFKGHKGPVVCMATDANGKVLYTGGNDSTIRSWDILRGDGLKIFDGHKQAVLCLSVHNKLMYSGSQDCSARCWVREFGDCTRIYKGGQHSITCVRFHEGYVFTGSGDTCARAYEAKSGAMKMIFAGHCNGIQSMAFAGQKMYTGASDGTVKVWDISNLDVLEDVVPDEESDSDDDDLNEQNNNANYENDRLQTLADDTNNLG